MRKTRYKEIKILATQKQKNLLDDLGVPYDTDISKDEACELIENNIDMLEDAEESYSGGVDWYKD